MDEFADFIEEDQFEDEIEDDREVGQPGISMITKALQVCFDAKSEAQNVWGNCTFICALLHLKKDGPDPFIRHCINAQTHSPFL